MNEQWSSWIHQPTPLVVFRSRSRCRSRFGKPLKRKPLKPGATSSNQWGLGLHNRAQLTPDLPCWPGTSWEKGSLPLRLSSQPTPFLPLLSLSLSVPGFLFNHSACVLDLRATCGPSLCQACSGPSISLALFHATAPNHSRSAPFTMFPLPAATAHHRSQPLDLTHLLKSPVHPTATFVRIPLLTLLLLPLLPLPRAAAGIHCANSTTGSKKLLDVGCTSRFIAFFFSSVPVGTSKIRDAILIGEET